MHANELKLIQMVIDLQANQSLYRAEIRKFGNSSTQLEICKKKEKELKKYCSQRLKEIESAPINQTTQQQLFT